MEPNPDFDADVCKALEGAKGLILVRKAWPGQPTALLRGGAGLVDSWRLLRLVRHA